jgi:hypothetical protein
MFKKRSLDRVSLLTAGSDVRRIRGGEPMRERGRDGRWLVAATFCALLFLTALVPRVQAKTNPFKYAAAGSFGPDLYVFADGTSGNSITLIGWSNAGPISAKEWGSGSANGKSCTPPSGVAASGVEVTFTDSFEIITVIRTGDQLFQNLVSGTECIDFTPPEPPFPFDGTLTVQNVGGTGKFSGATGTETLHFTGQILNCGSSYCIGSVRHTEDGSVTTPE